MHVKTKMIGTGAKCAWMSVVGRIRTYEIQSCDAMQIIPSTHSPYNQIPTHSPYNQQPHDNSTNKHTIPSRELFIETRRNQLNTAEHPCSSSHQSPGTCISSEVSEPSPCTPCTPDAAPASWSAWPTPLPPIPVNHLLVENRLGLTSETLLLGIVSSLT